MKTTIELKQEELLETKKLKQEIALCGIVTVILVIALFYHPFSILAFVISALAILFMPEESILSFFMFTINLANIFRFSVSSTSFFILLEFFAVAIMIIKRKHIDVQHFFGIIALLIYSLIPSMFVGQFNSHVYIRFAASLCMVAIFTTCDWEKNIKRIVGFFSGGVIVESVIALMNGILPVSSYISAERLAITGSEMAEEAYRFTALQPDPNYYVVSVTCAIIGLAYFLIFKMTEKKLICIAAIITLFIMGLLTYSKSFYLIIVFLYVYFLVISIVKSKYKFTGVLILLAVVGLAVILSGNFNLVNRGLERVTSFKDANDFTTNRLNIWTRYFDYYKDNFFAFAFGGGIGYQPMRVAAHNTYIDIITNFGLVGIIFFIVALSSITTNKKINRQLENYFILVAIIIMYFFLSSLTWYDSPFQVLLAYFFLNLEPGKKGKISAVETLTDSDWTVSGKSAKTV